MAVTTLSDLTHKYDLNLLWDFIQLEATAKNAYFQSGVIATDPILQAQITSGDGLEFSIPIVDDLGDGTDAAIGTADTTTLTPDKITTDDMRVSKQFRAKSWAVPDLMASLAGTDLMTNVQRRWGAWWSRHYQRALIASTRGVLNSNVAGTGDQTAGDMVHAIQLSGAGDPGAANKISGSAVIDATATLGDRWDELAAMAMHSAVFHQLRAQQLITFEREMDGPKMIPFYQGLRVIVDDDLTPVSDGDRNVYMVVFYAAGAFMWGLGRPKNAVATQRKEEQGTGTGVDELYTRSNYAIHPYGFTYLKDAGGSQSGVSPTFANLATAAKWDRPVDRKLAKMAFLTVNI